MLVYTTCNSLLQTSFITFRNGFDYNGLRTHELPRRNASYLSTRVYKFTHNMHNMPVREEYSTNASGESYELSTCPPGELTQEQNYFLLVAAPGCSELDATCVVMLSSSLTASSKPRPWPQSGHQDFQSRWSIPEPMPVDRRPGALPLSCSTSA